MPVDEARINHAVRAYFNGRTVGPGAISLLYAVRAVKRILNDESLPHTDLEARVRAFAAEHGIAIAEGDRYVHD